MQGASHGDLLHRVMDRLLQELPDVGRAVIIGANSPFRADTSMSELLSDDDELLAESLRTDLATIATRLSTDGDDPPVQSVEAALDGAETVIRGQLMAGRNSRLPRLLPSLVFLVALPIVEQDRALTLSLRTSELIAEEGDV